MTTFLKLTNRGVSSLATTIDDSELVISVQSGDGALFPSTFPFHVSVGAEIMSCTGRATDALTVTRGVEGTSGAIALEGAVVSLNITAGVIDTITDALDTLEAVTPLLADGSEDLTGAWNLGSQALTNVATDIISEATAATGVTIDSVLLKDGLVDGIDVAARDHAVYTDAEAIAAVEGEATLALSGAVAVSGTLSYKGLLPITDPGNGGAIPVTVSGVVPIVTGGAETRTLADPLAVGQEMIIGLKTYIGDCVITSASPVNQTGNTILTGGAVGAYIHLVAIEDEADIEWRIVANDGWALS